jgi:lipopolysaccharide transport protein LptA
MARILLWGSLWFVPLAHATDLDAVHSPEQTTSVTITADELIGDDATKTAEFVGNVKAVRGKYSLTTDRLIMYFDSKEKTSEKQNGPQANIREIVAEGRVRILSDELDARADHAVYNRRAQTLVLTGNNTEVNRNGSRISGARITIFIDTEKVIIQSREGSKVQGVFNIPQKN